MALAAYDGYRRALLTFCYIIKFVLSFVIFKLLARRREFLHNFDIYFSFHCDPSYQSVPVQSCTATESLTDMSWNMINQPLS